MQVWIDPTINWDFTAIYPPPTLEKAPVLAAEPSEEMDACRCLSSAQLGALVHIHPHQWLKLI